MGSASELIFNNLMDALAKSGKATLYSSGTQVSYDEWKKAREKRKAGRGTSSPTQQRQQQQQRQPQQQTSATAVRARARTTTSRPASPSSGVGRRRPPSGTLTGRRTLG